MVQEVLYKKLEVNNQDVIESENKISRLKVSWFSRLRPERKVGNALNGHLMIPSMLRTTIEVFTINQPFKLYSISSLSFIMIFLSQQYKI